MNEGYKDSEEMEASVERKEQKRKMLENGGNRKRSEINQWDDPAYMYTDEPRKYRRKEKDLRLPEWVVDYTWTV